MSDSGDDLSSAANIAPDAEIEKCLRDVVRKAVKKGEDVTIKLARSRAEERLGLESGFLKDNAQWKQKSKDLIGAAFEEPPSPEALKKTAPAHKAKPVPKAGTKRRSDEAQPAKTKRQKKDAVSDTESVDDVADDGFDNDEDKVEGATPAKLESKTKSEEDSDLSDPPQDDSEEGVAKSNGKTAPDEDETELSSVIDDAPPKKKRQKKATSSAAAKSKASKTKKVSKPKAPAEEDESDLSSVIDDPPPKKGRKKKSTSPSTAAKAKTTKAKPAPGKNLSPDEEEIKRLQSWLLKCGIRKLWHRELAPFDTNKEKIKHLKSMLEDAGMTGRFSEEKAKQIKEARELKAELESATEFNKTWGHEGDGSDDEGGKDGGEEEEKKPPVRRAKPKGFVDFGDSDEESE